MTPNLLASNAPRSPSPTLAIHELSGQKAAAGETIFRLGFGQSPFPVPDLVVEALRASAHVKEYLPVRGLPALREAISAYARRSHSLDFGVDDLIVGPGTKELMFLVQLVLDAELLLPSPSWVSYAPQARLASRSVRWLPCSPDRGWKLQPDTLAAACLDGARTSRLLLLNSPCNPTGAAYSASELAALADVARQHDLLVLSDEIYAELHHDGTHCSVATFAPERTLVTGGLSKWCGAGGWRLGWLGIPRALRWLGDAVVAAASETYSCASAPVQYAAVSAYREEPALEDYLRRSRAVLRAIGRRVRALLTPVQVELDGGFYVFPRMVDEAGVLAARGIADSGSLAMRLLEDTGVAVLPGVAFGRPPAELSMRLAYVDFDGAPALVAVDGNELADDQLEAICPNVVEGVRRLVDWCAE